MSATSKHTLVVIGFLSSRYCYLDVSVEEAMRRYAAPMGENWVGEPVIVIEFDDEFCAYDVWSADGHPSARDVEWPKDSEGRPILPPDSNQQPTDHAQGILAGGQQTTPPADDLRRAANVLRAQSDEWMKNLPASAVAWRQNAGSLYQVAMWLEKEADNAR